MVKLIAEHGVRWQPGNPPIAFAAGQLNIPIAEYFIRRVEDVNAADTAEEAPLAYAVFQDNVALVRLLWHGARVDVRDCAGHTMFALPKLQGDASLARELRSKGSPE